MCSHCVKRSLLLTLVPHFIALSRDLTRMEQQRPRSGNSLKFHLGAINVHNAKQCALTNICWWATKWQAWNKSWEMTMRKAWSLPLRCSPASRVSKCPDKAGPTCSGRDSLIILRCKCKATEGKLIWAGVLESKKLRVQGEGSFA